MRRESVLEMKRVSLLFRALLFLSAFCVLSVFGEFCVFAEADEKDIDFVYWGQNYIEGTGMAVAPTNARGAQAKVLARRGAIVDLQRNLLESIGGVQVDSRTTMNDFMAEDRVRTEVNGLIQGIQLMDGKWDGEAYTVTGRIRTEGLRVIWELCRDLALKR